MTMAAREAVREAHRSAARWPYAELDPAALRATGWTPTPFREIVLKVHQRCNLACDYCYVYEQADQSWRDRPRMMSEEIRRAAAGAIRRHAEEHGLNRVRIILHGGEPLLYGPRRLGELAAELRAAAPPGCTVEIGMQTNGVRLTEATVAVLREHDVKCGVSVDGTQRDHDRHRKLKSGEGSFTAVQNGLDLLRRPENRSLYAGLLCTVSPDTDPVETFEQLAKFEPPVIDFLLPHANHESRPWLPAGASPTAYGEWLVKAFDHWYLGRPSQPTPRVRLFEDVMRMVLKGSSSSEQIGLSPSATLVIETDGAIEQVDALKSAYEGAGATGLDVTRDEFDAAFDDPGVAARQIGLRALSDTCLSCRFHPVCGGGHYAHRYRPGDGFRQPSVYCDDLRLLIDHIHHRLEADIQRMMAMGEP
ncbi:FxsB family cyclophane-forming radical SAM/SPASM peptide maturase [Actinoplanes sp. NPDC051470]|uniref:FxsB family cyclophane-forming radical SAM/SPASM peptide maturase n=1 Tax=unclassified Actinoplanes TaxID=2626549 RepID=UPI00342EBB15